ncbi:MFS transporter [Caldivirga maquilingensis]|uniref:Major facilitator superfamily MFS_1 n=1 Tax=Caldivirga maquilingensis (strain ATCC 700844 / DSM 13496 / JCM 10307 / IC-167) TaxID=397948 RepID=A8M9X0_CALMQ|nr:MFS transporter [Caldivirga maquilingensis]ABW02441.1 major facilitator superfamily MFS_1 [Caldivirga maquilingensis IC-167]
MYSKTPFEPLDWSRPTPGHIRILLISGAGFFADAYDLFAISIALVFLKQVWSLSASDVSLISSAALFGAVIGPFIFGRIGDVFGRKYVYGVEAALLAAGSMVSALSVNPTMLWITRFILGLGVGGDYPISATLMSEYAPAKSRGLFVAGVFSMQGWGIVAAALIGLGLLHANVNPDVAWRIILGFGAVAPALVIYFRRRVHETPRFEYFVKGDVEGARKAMRDVLMQDVNIDGRGNVERINLVKYIPVILGTAVPWFALDVFFYGINIFGPFVVTAMGLAGSPLSSIYIQLYAALAFLVPGYYVAAFLVDKIGRRSMQIMGFSIVAVVYLITALMLRNELIMPTIILALYGLAQFFTNVGPNVTTFITPTEVFPTRFRSTGHGIAAGSGKLGAALAALLIPIYFPITSNVGTVAKYAIMSRLLLLLAVMAIVGIAFTLLIKEPKGKPLELSSGEVASQ